MHPPAYSRRSFVYRTLVNLGAKFGELNGGGAAMSFGALEAELEQARSLAIADLSPLPRTGVKGPGTVAWLQSQWLKIGADSNQAYRQSDGTLAARLAPNEILVLDSLAGEGKTVARIDAAWRWSEELPRPAIGYPVPRQDSHCWFALSGAQAPAMFSKICGVDLRPDRFGDGAIAQTSIAKMSGIIIRDDLGGDGRGGARLYHLLADSASAEYLWGAVSDAMEEFEGAPIGLLALRRLAGMG